MNASWPVFSVMGDRSAWIMLGDTTVSVLLRRLETTAAKVSFPPEVKFSINLLFNENASFVDEKNYKKENA